MRWQELNNYMKPDSVFTCQVGSQEYTFRSGRLAEQAGGAVTLQVGESMVFASATMSKETRDLNFFPLSVDFEEKMYAAGRIPGGFFRREGRPTTDAVLTSRLTDRPLRPLFPDGMRNDVQVIITTISSDDVHQLDILSVNAASAALHISNTPWNGPIAAVRVGYINDELVINPTIQEIEESTLDLRLAGTKDAIIMVEAGAKEVTEELIVEALEFGHQAMQPIIELLEQMRAEIGKPKSEVVLKELDADVYGMVKERVFEQIKSIVVETEDRHERSDKLREVRESLIAQLTEEAGEDGFDSAPVYESFDKMIKSIVRDRILYDGVRPDGRSNTDIRELSSDTGISPRAHGSGLFRRGETQVLSILALGTPREAQKLDGLSPRDSRRFMHDYNFPPFSTGETWPLRGPKRREIGHGALGETALRPMIPDEEVFPYAIRVVSEVLSSNGSTSQASICAATLALMDGGVPIKSPVAGAAMGLISDGEKYAVLTDIQGMEDHLGDMDFKVAGTSTGITALQMDIKISGLSKEIMAEAMEQARQARLAILQSMLDTLPEARKELNKYAPRMTSISIDPEKIGAIIGKGGATIRGLEENYEVSIDIKEDGTVFVAGVNGEKADEALEVIRGLAIGPELGQIYSGKVVRITDFGAFIEILPGVDGMVHISQISSEHVRSVEDVFQLGDEVMTMVTDVTSEGKVRLSRKAVLEGWSLEEAREQDRPSGGRSGGGRGRGRGGDRGGRGGNRRRRD